MEVYSLEDEDKGLLTTQSITESEYSESKIGILRDLTDFQSPCALVLNVKQLPYSNMSEDDLEIPCSQNDQNLLFYEI